MNKKADAANADSLFNSGNYFEASIEYEYLIFRAEQPENLNLFKYKKALCYKKLNDFNRAINELQSAYFENPKEDTLYRFVCYEQSLCFYLNGEPQKALWKIDEYFHLNADSSLFFDFLPIRAICLNETFQWDEARKCLLAFVQMQDLTTENKTELEHLIHELYHKKNVPKIRSVKKAELFSRIIPGTGQIYAGMTGEGIVNFLINASILAFTAHQAYNGFYITGYLAGLGFFNKTYHGGIKRAEAIALQKNKELIANLNSRIIALISTGSNSN
ncbi:MAG TPA: hypothetical protein DER09_07720 [Prolixibacteraceae bacterium]|nr:hypothetical protein [Prolixibacteraceae bacterium]